MCYIIATCITPEYIRNVGEDSSKGRGCQELDIARIMVHTGPQTTISNISVGNPSYDNQDNGCDCVESHCGDGRTTNKAHVWLSRLAPIE